MFEVILIFIIGLSFGSFANVCIYRLPLDKSIIPSSACPHCNEKIKHMHNIPVLSFLFLKGLSFCCHKKISPHYPLVEITIGMAAAFLFIDQGYSWTFILSLVFYMALIILLVTDIQRYIIPNTVSYSVAVIGIISSLLHISPFATEIIDSLIGGAASGLLLILTSKVYFYVRKKEGMGMGDVKMIAMIGFWMGLQATVVIIILSAILGSLAGITLILFKKIHREQYIPYGSFLSLSTLLIWFIGVYFKINFVHYFSIFNF